MSKQTRAVRLQENRTVLRWDDVGANSASILPFLAEAKPPTTIASVVLSRSKFKTLAEAQAWAEKHGFKHAVVVENTNDYTFQQQLNQEFQERSFAIIPLEEGAQKIVGKLKSEVTAEAKTGREWDIVVVEGGLSLNGRYYSPDCLKKAAPLFEDCNVYIHKFAGDEANHLPGNVRAAFPAGVAGNLIGYLTEAHYDEKAGKQGMGAIVARLHVADQNMRSMFKNLYEENRTDKLGFSIDVEGFVSPMEYQGKQVVNVESIERVYALDAVTHPAAGGRLDRLVASKETENTNMNPKLLAFLKKYHPALVESVSKLDAAGVAALVRPLVEAQLREMEIKGPADALAVVKEVQDLLKANKLDEAVAKLAEAEASLMSLMGMGAPAGAPAAKAPPALPAGMTASQEAQLKAIEEAQKQMAENLKASQIRESKAILAARLAGTKLPQAMKDRVAKEHEGKILTEAEADAAVASATDLVASLVKSGEIVAMAEGGNIIGGASKEDKMQMAMDLAIGYVPLAEEKGKYAGIAPFRGIREAYSMVTGDQDVRWKRTNDKRMVEALTTDFPKIMGDSITRRLLQMYRSFPENWRKLASVVPVNDFRTQRRIQWGYFGNLAIVAEDAAFTALSNPSEKEATYTPAKRGKKFAITREMILQDDLRKLRQIPAMMARAANRTLEQFVFDQLLAYTAAINDTNIYDGTVLYTAGHANKGTAALDSTSLRAGLIRVRKQTDEGGVETLGLQPKYLWTPLELGPTANVLVNSERLPNGTNANDINDNYKAVEPIAVPYLRGDADNWYLSVAPSDLEGIEVGFVGGQEEPEVLVQDGPSEGDVFTNERITYKVRHEYGAAVVDFRGFDGSIVP